MNKTKWIMMFLVGCLLTACMDGHWDEPKELASRGNKAIQESNVVTIAQLKDSYKSFITTDYRDGVSYKQIDQDMQIKGVVTANDIEGNVYNEIALQDETGAIIISISEGGIWGYLPVGTEIVVDLKGLYIGNYGLQPVLGTPYTNKDGAVYVSRMSRILWNQHFKFTGNTREVTPVKYDDKKWDNFADAGKLVVMQNVQFDVPNDTTMFANPGKGPGSVSLYFKGMGKNVFAYNSNFADFAASYVPRAHVDVVGIMKTYGKNRELIIRSYDDIQIVK